MNVKKIIKMVLKKNKKSNINITESISSIRSLMKELTTSLDDLNTILKRICFKKK